MKNELNEAHGSIVSYSIGFGLALLLTIAAYVVTKHHVNSGHVSPSDTAMQVILIVLAVVQLFVQMFFFLHLGRETKPRWRSMAFIFALGVVLIVVVGSVWIMNNLNYRMDPHEINNYLRDQDGGI